MGTTNKFLFVCNHRHYSMLFALRSSYRVTVDLNHMKQVRSGSEQQQMFSGQTWTEGRERRNDGGKKKKCRKKKEGRGFLQ